ncbi:hypothetical protein [Kitasatospora acidiphila]|uniref:hypothetical protein n=1 Tax=Kitasatospora acidiphila TaxID=2567942 RepID=UPI003C77F897
MTTYPENVIARYLTVGGAHVDVYDATVTAVPGRVEIYDGAEWPATKVSATAVCSGCTNKQIAQDTLHPLATEGPSVMDWAVANVRRWAQSHAEKCRAMPRPKK